MPRTKDKSVKRRERDVRSFFFSLLFLPTATPETTSVLQDAQQEKRVPERGAEESPRPRSAVSEYLPEKKTLSERRDALVDDGHDDGEERTASRRERPSLAATTTDTALASPRHGVGRGGSAPSRRRLANTHAPRRRRWPPASRRVCTHTFSCARVRSTSDCDNSRQGATVYSCLR